MNSRRIIGTDHLSYPQRRNFAELPLQGYEVRKYRNFYSLPNYLHFRITGTSKQIWLNSHRPLGPQKVHAWHLFNAISLGNQPWVTTFETLLPRWGEIGKKRIEKGMRLMAGPACKALIALSQCTYNLQKEYLEAEFSAYLNAILPKLHVIHPPQSPLIQEYAEKKRDPERIHFTLVGNQIFSKGGRESLAAAVRLHREGYALHLHIVSGLRTDGYASHTGPEDVVEFRKALENAGEVVTFHSRLSNPEVLELWKRSHVALLPTYADTYGYSALEAQAAGCPVITTNVRALPEINNEQTGWLIEVPLDPKRNAVLDTGAARSSFREHLGQRLYETMKGILDAPEVIEQKGKSALGNILLAHSPSDRARMTETIYNQIGEGR